MQTRRDLERALLGFVPPEVSPADLNTYLAFKMAAMPKGGDTRAFPADPSASRARAQLKAALPVAAETAASFAPGSGEYLSAKSAMDNSAKIIPALREGRYLDALGNTAGMAVDTLGAIPLVHEGVAAAKLAAAKGLPLALAYTRNGVPHNHPEVVGTYIDRISEAFKDSGITPKFAKADLTGYRGNPFTQVEIKFERDGDHIGTAYRTFNPEDVYATALDSHLPEGEKMGVIPILYPAESNFMKEFGGIIDGTFIHPKTEDGFKRVHPDYEQPFAPSVPEFYKAEYPGEKDFIVSI